MRESFLKSTDVVDWTHPLVRDRATVLSRGLTDVNAIAQRCFEWHKTADTLWENLPDLPLWASST